MKEVFIRPLPDYNLWLSFSLDTLFLPRSHPPGVFYHPNPAGTLTAYQPLTPAFWAWFNRQLATFRVSAPDEVARSAPIRASLTEYVTLRYTAQELSAAVPFVYTPDDPEDIIRLLAFADDPADHTLHTLVCPACSRKTAFPLARPLNCGHCRKLFPRDYKSPATRLAYRRCIPSPTSPTDNFANWIASK